MHKNLFQNGIWTCNYLTTQIAGQIQSKIRSLYIINNTNWIHFTSVDFSVPIAISFQVPYHVYYTSCSSWV